MRPPMRPRVVWLAGLVLAALAAPVAAQTPVDSCQQQCTPTAPDVNPEPLRADGPVNVLLYVHWQDVLNRAPANTFNPDEVGETDIDRGLAVPTIATHTDTAADVSMQNNRVHFWPLAGPIETRADGTWRYLQGQALEHLEVSDDPLILYAYYSFQSPASASTGLPATASSPIEVKARWETGLHPGSGLVVAQGTAGPFVPLTAPTGAPVYEIRIPLIRESADQLCNPDGCIITVSLSQADTDAGEYMGPEWRVRSGPAYPWRVVLPIAEPLIDAGLDVRNLADHVQFAWRVTSPLGTYDVDRTSFTGELVTPDGVVHPLPSPQINLPPPHVGPFAPITAAWTLPRADAALHEGGLLRATVTNHQGTFILQAEHPVEPGLAMQPANAPAPALAAFLALGAAAMAGLRRGEDRA